MPQYIQNIVILIYNQHKNYQWDNLIFTLHTNSLKFRVYLTLSVHLNSDQLYKCSTVPLDSADPRPQEVLNTGCIIRITFHLLSVNLLVPGSGDEFVNKIDLLAYKSLFSLAKPRLWHIKTNHNLLLIYIFGPYLTFMCHNPTL